jgi:hypothetical protein
VQEKRMSVKSLLCKIPFIGHNWSDWGYISPESCEQKRICSRDGTEEKRVFHQWSEWKPSSSSIYQERECLRCKEIETEQDEYVYTDEQWKEDLKAYGYPSNWNR